MDEQAKEEFIKNFEKELETNKEALTNMKENRDKLAEDQKISDEVHDLIIKYPKRLNPEYEFETRPEYWELMKAKQALKKHYEAKRVQIELDRLDKTINQTETSLKDRTENKEERIQEYIKQSEEPKEEAK